MKKEPRIALGLLPLARRDIERLRQILGLQRRLIDAKLSPRARRALMHRGAVPRGADLAGDSRPGAGGRASTGAASSKPRHARAADEAKATGAAPPASPPPAPAPSRHRVRLKTT